jgi:hypothetical protein
MMPRGCLLYRILHNDGAAEHHTRTTDDLDVLPQESGQ